MKHTFFSTLFYEERQFIGNIPVYPNQTFARHKNHWTQKSQMSLQWRHNEHASISNHQPNDYLLNGLFGRKSTVTSKLRITGLCVGNSAGTGEFPAQKASKAENVSIWWRHHGSDENYSVYWYHYENIRTQRWLGYFFRLITELFDCCIYTFYSVPAYAYFYWCL